MHLYISHLSLLLPSTPKYDHEDLPGFIVQLVLLFLGLQNYAAIRVNARKYVVEQVQITLQLPQCYVNFTYDMFVKDTGHTVVNSVREKRTLLKLTQDELADKVQATRQTIIAIEKGNYVPSVLLALRLSSILNCSVEDVFQYEKI